MEGLFLTALLLFIMKFVDDLALTVVNRAISIRYDQYIFCFDRLFGSPSFAMGQLFLRLPWFRNLSLYAYVLVPSVCLALASACFWQLPIRDAICCVRTIFLSCLLAYPLYMLLPVSGPRYAFPAFPFAAPDHLVPHLVSLRAVPNGVPSVHMTLAVLILWFARPWKTGTVLASIFLALTVVATLGSGEHYFMDLLAAVPYALLVIYLGGYSSSASGVNESKAQVREPEIRAQGTDFSF